jgi:hypothetical protein
MRKHWGRLVVGITPLLRPSATPPPHEQIVPRDGGNASLIAGMIQTLNGLRSALGLVRPH